VRYEKERHAANGDEDREHGEEHAVRLAAESAKQQDQDQRNDCGDPASYAEDGQEHVLKLGIHFEITWRRAR
jgi:hypothetical protein